MDINTDIQDLIAQGRIADAIDALRIRAAADYHTMQNLEQTASTYSAMIATLERGIPDPGRADMLDSIAGRLSEMADDLDRRALVASDSREYFATARSLAAAGVTPISAALAAVEAQNAVDFAESDAEILAERTRRYEESADRLFMSLWTAPALSREEADCIADTIFASDSNMPELKLLTASALQFALLQYFDDEKLRILCDAFTSSDSDHLCARSVTAIYTTLMAHHDSVAASSASVSRLTALSLDPTFAGAIRNVALQFMRTADNDRLTSQFKSEILPEIMKLQPEIMKRLGSMQSEGSDDPMEQNPQWEEMLEGSGLAEKLRRFNDLQEENGDVMMLAFANLTSQPFFANLTHWLVPFDIQRSELASLRNSALSPLLSMFGSESCRICDSDKYSLAFALLAMPAPQRDLMTAQLSAQFAQLEEAHNASIDAIVSPPDLDDAITRYVRELYRIFRGYRRRSDLPDPFAPLPDPAALPVLGVQAADPDTIRLQAEFYFNRGYFDRAVDFFSRLTATADSDAAAEQKCGYALQSLGRYDEALEHYRHAEFLGDANTWLLRRMAVCSKNVNRLGDAEKYYRKALETEPEHIRTLLNLGHCLLEQDKIDDALAVYYKAYFLDSLSDRALRPLAWCEMLVGHYDKSDALYRKILDAEPLSADCLNAAHLALVQGDTARAMSLYRRGLASAGSKSEFISNFLDDAPVLHRLGIRKADIALVADALRS